MALGSLVGLMGGSMPADGRKGSRMALDSIGLPMVLSLEDSGKREKEYSGN